MKARRRVRKIRGSLQRVCPDSLLYLAPVTCPMRMARTILQWAEAVGRAKNDLATKVEKNET